MRTEPSTVWIPSLSPHPTPVYLAPELSLDLLRDRSKWPADFKLESPRVKKLKVGMVLLMPVHSGLFLGFVVGSPQGEPYFISTGKSLVAKLEFDQDHWVCGELLQTTKGVR